MFSRIPPFVLRLIAKEAERSVVCGPTAADDLPLAALREYCAANGIDGSEAGPKDLIYEVARQQTNGSVIFLAEHMDRFARSCVEVFGASGEKTESLVFNAREAVSRLQKAHAIDGKYFEQSIKYVAWVNREVATEVSLPLDMSTLAFFIKSSYPPAEWYTAAAGSGASMGLLFGPRRTNPHAKVVYPELKAKAARLVGELGVYESLIVHDDGLVPEGTRSNYILVTKGGEVLSSDDDDILIGTTLLAVRNQCARLGIPLLSRRLTVQDVVEAEALAMLGTSVNVLPINEIVLSPDDVGHASLEGLAALFSKRPDGCLHVSKNSGSNAVLRRLNDEYTSSTFS